MSEDVLNYLLIIIQRQYNLKCKCCIRSSLRAVDEVMLFSYSIADKETYCAFYDKSMTFLPLVQHILRVILRCGGKLDLISDDL